MNEDHDIPPSSLDEIERYLLQQMSAAERASFELQIADNNILAGQVQQVRRFMVGIQESALQERLDHYHAQIPSTNKSLRLTVSMRNIIAIAAVLVLIATGAWLFISQKSPNEKIYARYFKADPGLITAMSSTDNYVFDRAMIDYKTGNYDAALKAWQGLLAANKHSDTLNYFVGSAYMAKQKPAEALPYFKAVIANGTSYFLSDAYWYAGLASLKTNDRQNAVKYIGQSAREEKAALLQQLSNTK